MSWWDRVTDWFTENEDVLVVATGCVIMTIGAAAAGWLVITDPVKRDDREPERPKSAKELELENLLMDIASAEQEMDGESFHSRKAKANIEEMLAREKAYQDSLVKSLS